MTLIIGFVTFFIIVKESGLDLEHSIFDFEDLSFFYSTGSVYKSMLET